MRFVHASPHIAAEVTAFTDKTGWEHVLVVMKATYAIPEPKGAGAAQIPPLRTPQLLAPQPLAMKDDYDGEAGLSAPLYENDFASRKACCDVLFKAHAHAPEGKPVRQLDVAVRVGSMSKAVHVVGNRTWEKDLLFIRSSAPQPFVTMPLHYGRAFGGCTAYEENGQRMEEGYLPNPVGTGYSKRKSLETLYGMALPNLEMPGRPLQRPDEPYPALALSPTARNFYPRYTYAGTYDAHWKNELAPFLPQDFDERYFQCAPQDQQMPYPQGGEEVCLINMMHERPEVRFTLPPLGGRIVRVLGHDLSITEVEAVPDTLFFEPDERRFSVVWRASKRLGHKGLHELRMVVAGDICPQWWDAVQLGSVGCAGCEAFDAACLPKGCPHREGFPAQQVVEPRGREL